MSTAADIQADQKAVLKERTEYINSLRKELETLTKRSTEIKRELSSLS